MSEVKFRDSSDSTVLRPIRVGIVGPSGGGKTLSALKLGKGMCGDWAKVYVIDTESPGALAYREQYRFQHAKLSEPFSYEAYAAAIKAASDAGAEVVVVDQISNGHDGIGGYLEQHREETTRLAKLWKVSEGKAQRSAWIEPKHRAGKFVQFIQQQGVPMIFCFRAKDPVDEVKVNGKTKMVRRGWTPITTGALDYEMDAGLVLPLKSDGVPDLQIRKTRNYLDGFFPAGEALSEAVGARLSEWVCGGAAKAPGEEPHPALDGFDSQDLFEHFDDLLSRDVTNRELEEIREDIAKKVDDLSPAHYKKLRAVYAAKLKELS